MYRTVYQSTESSKDTFVVKKETTKSESYDALELWTKSRSYPNNDISSKEYFKAFQKVKSTFKEYRRAGLALNPWQSIGPSNLSGRLISIAINPLNPQTIYVGSASGGVWRTFTGGTAGDWQRIVTGFPVLGVGAIAIDPTDTNIVYIGTGEVYRYQGSIGGTVIRTTRGSYGIGILKTTDAGVTWTKNLDWSYNQERGIQKIVINPLNHNTMFAATTEGIYKSTDAGTVWQRVDSTKMAMDIIIHPTDTNKIMATTGNFFDFLNIPSVLRSIDGGLTWENITFTFSTAKTLLEMYAANPNVVYASVADSTTDPASLWRSTNFGTTWTLLNSSVNIAPQGWFSHFVAVHPTDSLKIIHGTRSSFRSTNGGNTFTLNTQVTDLHGYAHHPTNPEVIYIVCDFGIYRSDNFGATYTTLQDLNGGLQTTQFYSGFTNSSTDSNMAVGGIQDLGAPMYNGGTLWGTGYAVGESGWKIIHPLDDNVIYSATPDYIFISRDRGASHSYFTYPYSSFGSWNTPCILSPSQPLRVYYARTNIYRTNDSGATWTNLGQLDGNPVLSMAISSTNADTLYVGTAATVTRPHLYRTANGGNSWTDITGTLPDRFPNDIALDPNNSSIVYVTFGGFGSGHVFKSTNAGTTWSDITGSLPDIPTSAVFVDPINTNFLYVGNDLGVFVSTDAGTSWSSFNEGLPEAVIVSDLTYSPSNQSLRVTTHGNGAYQHRLPNAQSLLVLDSPNGGESLQAGSIKQITWHGDVVSSVNLEYSLNNGIEWKTISQNVPANLPYYNWTVPYSLSDEVRIRISSTNTSSINDNSDNLFSIVFDGKMFTVSNRWNLVSLPVIVSNASTDSIFPTGISDAYYFDGNYSSSDSILHGRSYWLKFNGEQIIAIKGTPLTEDTISVNPGWNLIGSIGSAVSVNTIHSIPPGIVTSEFYGYDKKYFVTDSIFPGKGSWVNVQQEGELILSSLPTVKSKSTITIVHTENLPPSPPFENDETFSSFPTGVQLNQNYPNPFNPVTTISYSLPENTFVTIKIYDIGGNEIETLVQELQTAGTKSIEWNAKDLPSGIYFCRLVATGFGENKKTFNDVKKLILLK
jgi:photosystem II stability/assembly factor-like uncharacterized protein